VLVEKAFTVNAAQASTLIEAARAQGVFLMEAMWTRFLPHVVRIRELLAEGALG
jgi:predicted dehydrogenase